MTDKSTEDNDIKNVEIDGGIVTMSAKGMKYESKDNEIETVEYGWKMNRAGLYSRLSERINEKLNLAIQGLEYDSFADPVVLYFSCSSLAKHFYNQLEEHGWVVTMDDDDVVQVDVTKSIDQMTKSNDDDDDIGDSGFFCW
ncbi:hypothetical protein [Schleiferilactobacillus harbinensis]|uniref:hypothetical protein n=1 Tax=Schleiferilactobacillus harbinensis TaxID=304207 RepID=UPI0007B86DE2|nr:hypothetical protein [Schleiferilactobacillus harbinensis]